MNIPDYSVIMLSGGLDSVVLLYEAVSDGQKVHAVNFRYGQRHIQELEWARTHCDRLGVLYTTFEIDQLMGSSLTDGNGSVVVPNRNAIFLSIACNIAAAIGAARVMFAANADDEAGFPDCREKFINAYNCALAEAEIPVKVIAPYLHLPKWQILRKGQDLGVKFSETWSCYEGGIQPCGKCGACVKRAEAEAAAKRMEPVKA